VKARAGAVLIVKWGRAPLLLPWFLVLSFIFY
jgi:hypothetical protein